MLVVVSDGGEEVGDVVIVQLVSHVPAVPTSVNEAQGAQQAQMVRRGAEAEPGRTGEVLDGALTAQHVGQQAKPAGGAERLQRLRELLGIALTKAPLRRGVFGRMRHRLIRLRHMSKCSTVASRALMLAVFGVVAESVPPYVIAAADPEQDQPDGVIAALREMTCERVDIKQLTTFRDEWLAELDQRQGG